jgi:Fe-S oxidoreductase
MLHGGAVSKGWDNPAVEEALDLCLACKGCKHDCPVNVDMATYKAEFRSHYYENKLRPRAAYSMGLVPVWAELASKLPGIANAAARNGILAAIGKFAAGIAQPRRIPPFATQTYMDWRRRNPTLNPNGKRVLLFPDTFNNYFRPAAAISATLVLEAAGWQVVVPAKPVCCGRPLYDWGMLATAEKWLCALLDELGVEIMSGTPLVGLEPACVATFRDELPDLFPRDRTARKLKENSFLVSEFLDRHCQDFKLPQIHGKALVQIHCHHHSVLNVEAEKKIMDRLGLDYEIMQSGCCGMAGSFGFESAKYDVSMRAAERIMLPRIRAADRNCLILADGFSCREQIEQGSGRKTRHLAEVVAAAI